MSKTSELVNPVFYKNVWTPFNLGYRTEAIIEAQKIATVEGQNLLHLLIRKDLNVSFNFNIGTYIPCDLLNKIIESCPEKRMWMLLKQRKIIDNSTYKSLSEFYSEFRNLHAHKNPTISQNKKCLEYALKKMEKNVNILYEKVMNFK